MASTRDIQRRIKGVKSTGKITRAMEMISAVKMRKAVSSTIAIRPYAESVLSLLHRVGESVGPEGHPLVVPRPVKRELYLVIGSNRGLCGAFNAQVGRRLRQALAEDSDREQVFVTIGRKADRIVKRLGGNILASFPDVQNTPRIGDMRPIAKLLVEEFETGRIDRAVMVYTDFVSVISQVVKVRALLPVAEKDSRKALHEMDPGAIPEYALSAECIIEPSPKKVLWRMIPKLIEMEMYHAVLESNASQEAARMMAMRNATDAAKEMVGNLTLAYNQIRQQKITAEIAELSAGKAALEG